MIVTDLDGTLLRDDKTISLQTLSVLRQCREKGIKVVYATGRSSTADKAAPAEYFDDKIHSGGARTYIDDVTVFSRPIPYRLARPFLSACVERGMRVYSQTEGVDYSNFVVTDVEPDAVCFKVVDLLLHNLDADKLCVVIDKPGDVQFIENHLPSDLHVTFSRYGHVMIMHRDATKLVAVSELARLRGISASEIVAFGDDEIDIDLLRYAGIGIAMGNAIDEVKAVADCTCLSNEADGVAEWIMGNILGNPGGL